MIDPKEIQKLWALIKELTARTEHGQLKWREIQETSPPVYTMSFTRNTVALWSVDDDGLHPFTIRLIDDQGLTVEEITTMRAEEGHNEFEDSIANLFRAARRSVRNVDLVIDQIMADLRNNKHDR